MKIGKTDYTLSSDYNVTQQQMIFTIRKATGHSFDYVSVSTVHAVSPISSGLAITGDAEATYMNEVLQRAMSSLDKKKDIGNPNYREGVSIIVSNKMGEIIESDKAKGTYKGS